MCLKIHSKKENFRPKVSSTPAFSSQILFRYVFFWNKWRGIVRKLKWIMRFCGQTSKNYLLSYPGFDDSVLHFHHQAVTWKIEKWRWGKHRTHKKRATEPVVKRRGREYLVERLKTRRVLTKGSSYQIQFRSLQRMENKHKHGTDGWRDGWVRQYIMHFSIAYIKKCVTQKNNTFLKTEKNTYQKCESIFEQIAGCNIISRN